MIPATSLHILNSMVFQLLPLWMKVPKVAHNCCCEGPMSSELRSAFRGSHQSWQDLIAKDGSHHPQSEAFDGLISFSELIHDRP
jgi:hypothetical protein